MRRSLVLRAFRLASAVVCVLGFLPGTSRSQDVAPVMIKGHPAHPTRVLAKLRSDSGVKTQAHVAALAGSGSLVTKGYDLVPGLVVFDVDPRTAMAAAPASEDGPDPREAMLKNRIAALRATGLYEYVEPDYMVFADAVPTDSAFTNGTLWGLQNTGQSGGVAGVDIDAVRAWDITTGSKSVIVAVIDSGIRYTHNDLAAQMWRNPGEIAGNGVDEDGNGYVDDVYGINAITGAGDPADDFFHGTHVAGIIAAAPNNGGPAVGVAWNVRLMACKFLGTDGSGTTGDAIECINYAIANGASIINCSWGGAGYSQALRDALAAAEAQGILVVVAAGNDSANNDAFPIYPANYDLDNLVVVTAINRTGYRPSWANIGRRTVDVGAPGDAIYSTFNRGDDEYYTGDGTSAATPFVTGIAVLLRSWYPGISLADLRDRIVHTTVGNHYLDDATVSGGHVSAYRALTETGDGQLELSVSPPDGETLFATRNMVMEVRVSDLLGVTGATVLGSLSSGDDLVFRDDGIFPDTVANDSRYTAILDVPAVETGLQLHVQASAPGRTSASADVNYLVETLPANDQFAGRLALAGNQVQTTGKNRGATREPGEPAHAGNVGGASVWWTWTAPVNCTATISTGGSNFDTLLAVYTGSALGNLNEVASNDDSPDAGYATTRNSSVTFSAQAGVTYQIAVDGFNGDTGYISLSLFTSVAPANDAFASRMPLAGASVTTTGSTLSCTSEPGEPQHLSRSTDGSVWWSWTAPADGTATVTVNSGPTFTTFNVVAIYTGDNLQSLVPVAGRYDDPQGHLHSVARFAALSGTTYQIAVARASTGFGPGGAIALQVALSSTAPNDRFANRLVLSGTHAQATGSNVGATRETGEPRAYPDATGASVWWTWTAPADGTVVLSSAGTNFLSRMGVFTGSAVDALGPVVTSGNQIYGDPYAQVLTFAASAGTSYQIVVDAAWNGGSPPALGSIALDLSLISSPTNDMFSGRAVITGTVASVTATNVGATLEAGEAHESHYSGATIWWTWTAPAGGTVDIQIQTPDRTIAVYTGAEFASLVRVRNDIQAGTPSRFVFRTEAGVVYQISADGLDGSVGPVTLDLSLQNPPANDMFADRGHLSGRSVDIATSIRNATSEEGEPFISGPSVWWSWTAPVDGAAILSAITTGNPPPNISAFTGSSIDTLQQVFDTLTGSSGGSRLVIRARAGTTYHIAARSESATAATDFTLKLSQPGQPANDNFANSTALSGSSPTVFASNVGATPEPLEPSHTNHAAGASIWWTWIAPDTGTASITTTGSDFQTLLDVYRGSTIGSLTSVASNQYALLGSDPTRFSVGASRVVFPVEAGVAYRVSVTGYFGEMGNIRLNLQLAPRPGNDTYEAATVLSGRTVTVNGTNNGATADAGDPSTIFGSYLFSLGGSVWWKWTAPSSGPCVISTRGSDFDTVLFVQAGSLLLDNDDAPGLKTSRIGFLAEAGTTYFIEVDGRNGATGNIALSIQQPSAPPINDPRANASVIDGTSVRVVATTLGATAEPGEPSHEPIGSISYYAQASVWWKWTAPINGTATVTTSQGDFLTYIEAYKGTEPSFYNRVENSDRRELAPSVIFRAEAGETYMICVDPQDGFGGDFTLDVSLVPSPPNDRFEDRIALAGLAALETGSNVGATRDGWEWWTGSNRRVVRSVWWKWTAPADTLVVVSTAGSGFDTVLAVSTGESTDALTPVVSNDDDENGGRTSQVVFEATAGVAYQIAVDGHDGETGAIVLAVRTGAVPSVAAQVPTPMVAAGSPVTLSAHATGTGPFSYQWLFNGAEIPGATSSTLSIACVQQFWEGSYSVRVSNDFGESTSTAAYFEVTEPAPSNARLANLSTRALCLTGGNVLIPGFVVQGSGTKRVLIRAVGATLAEPPFNVGGVLPNPRMTLKRLVNGAYEDVAFNDDWGTSANVDAIRQTAAELFAFGLVENNPDAALLVELGAGQYTVLAEDADGAAGVAIVELYDAGPGTGGGDAKLVNISNRGFAGNGAEVMIPGFVVSSEGSKRLLIRAVGPTLAQPPFNVSGVLADPELTIYRREGNGAETPILHIDDWGEYGDGAVTTAVAEQVFAFPLAESSKDAAFVVTLNPGVYTVHAKGVGDTTGTVLVEIYEVP